MEHNIVDRITQLADLASRSAKLRLYKTLGYEPHNDNEEYHCRTHPFFILNDSILHDMQQLGTTLRNCGEDIRSSLFWPLLEHQHSYIEKFEFNRKIVITELTPVTIYDGLEKGNKILWQGWKIAVGGVEEVTDDYGQPAWENRIWVQSPDKKIAKFRGISKTTAKEVYRHIVGHDFKGFCSLGDDPPHPAEFRY